MELVTTDGFLLPTKELQRRGLMSRKGFPESYDRRALTRFVADIKAGKDEVTAPVYSHLIYDIVPDERLTVRRPDILIVEGLNVLQPALPGKDGRTRVGLADYFDFSVYVDARAEDIERWYLNRFRKLRETAFQDPSSYFRKYTQVSEEEALDYAPDHVAHDQQAQPGGERRAHPRPGHPRACARARTTRCSGSACASCDAGDRRVASAMLHLRLITPPDRTDAVVPADREDGRHHPSGRTAGRRPRSRRGRRACATWPARPATNCSPGCRHWASTSTGSIAVENIDLSLSERADEAEEDAPGEGADAVLWEQLDRGDARGVHPLRHLSRLHHARHDDRGLRCGPGQRDPDRGRHGGGPRVRSPRRHLHRVVRRSAAPGPALADRAAGGLRGGDGGDDRLQPGSWTRSASSRESRLEAARPNTGFIYAPDRFSFVVAVLAGVAGMLSLTSAKSGALVGVAISVTTVPAAANAAVALSYGDTRQTWGSTEQLLLNLVGIIARRHPRPCWPRRRCGRHDADGSTRPGTVPFRRRGDLRDEPRRRRSPRATAAPAPRPGSAQRRLHDVRQPPGDSPSLLDVGRLDHHPHQRLGPGGPQQHPPGAAELPLRVGDRRRPARAEVATRDLSTSGTLISTCGSRCMTPARSASVARSAATRAASSSPVSVPSPVVAWSRMITCPDCSPPSA